MVDILPKMMNAEWVSSLITHHSAFISHSQAAPRTPLESP